MLNGTTPVISETDERIRRAINDLHHLLPTTAPIPAVRQLGIQDEEFDVILAGSVFAGGALYIEPLENSIHQLAPRARLLKLSTPPVVGGVVLGMQKAGLDTVPLHPRLIASAQSFIPRSY